MKRKFMIGAGLLIGITAVFLFSGCVFAAVRAARYVERKINPPQPVLQEATTFFGGAVRAEAWLRPTESRWRGPAASADEPTNEPEGAAVKAGEENPRMALSVYLTNAGTVTLECSVLAVESPLGSPGALPKAVALSPGQRSRVGGGRSARADNFEKLTVAVTLQRGGEKETHELNLVPLAAAAK